MTSPTVRVHADLTVRVDDHTVVIAADGSLIRVEISDPRALVGVATSTSLPVGVLRPHHPRRTLARTADTLATNGLTVAVVGPDGRLATLGADVVGSRWARRVLGSDHVAVGVSSWNAVIRPVLVASLRHALAGVTGRVRRRR